MIFKQNNTIKFNKGNTYIYTGFVGSDEDPYDLTNAHIYMTIKTNLSLADASASLKITGTIVDTTSGKFTITFTRANTLTLTSGTYYYDIHFDNGSNVTKTLKQGLLEVKDVVTTTGGY